MRGLPPINRQGGMIMNALKIDTRESGNSSTLSKQFSSKSSLKLGAGKPQRHGGAGASSLLPKKAGKQATGGGAAPSSNKYLSPYSQKFVTKRHH